MTYDFSNHNSSKKKSKKKPPQKKQTPGWVWMLVGLLLGGAIVIFYPTNNSQTTLTDEELAIDLPEDADVKTPIEITHATKDTSTKTSSVAEPKTDESEDSTIVKPTQFEFYTILSEQEVMVQELQRPTAKNKSASNNTAKRKKISVRSDDQYLLQAGSFQKTEDAQRLATKIRNQGLNVNIEKSTIERNNQSSTWHRVMVGPLTSSDQIYKAETLLINQGIKTLLMKRR